MAEKNSVLVSSSRYTAGGITEVNNTALEWWERTQYPMNTDDRRYIVEERFAGRLDQITAMFLGEPRWWWVIAQYNNVLDPHAEITAGSILYIPTVEKTRAMLNGSVGGVASTREVKTSVLPIV